LTLLSFLFAQVLSVCSVQFKAVCDSLRGYDSKVDASKLVTIEGDTGEASFLVLCISLD